MSINTICIDSSIDNYCLHRTIKIVIGIPYMTTWHSVLAVSLVVAYLLSLGQRQPLPSNLTVDVLDTGMKYLHPRSLESRVSHNFGSLVKRLFTGIQGPESMYVLDDGGQAKGFVMDRYGYLYSGDIQTGEAHMEAYTGPGRPLGFQVLGKTVIICNALIGLVSFDLETKKISVLSNGYTVQGIHEPVSYANDLDVDEAASVVYFTDSAKIPPALNRHGFYDTMKSYMLSTLSGRATGALLRYDMELGETTLLMSNLHFANGVAVSELGDYVLVAETSALRVVKYFVSNGSSEILIDSLPGYPDGLCRSEDGTFWVALIVPCTSRSFAFQVLKSPSPVRWILSWIFSMFGEILRLPKLPKAGIVLQVNGETGMIMRALVDNKGDMVSGVSGVYEHNGTLYLGHLQYDYVTSVTL